MKIKDYGKDLRGYQGYSEDVVSIFVHFELAVLNHVNNRGKFTDKTLDKRIDKARREAFDSVLKLMDEAFEDGRREQEFEDSYLGYDMDGRADAIED